MVHRVRRTPEMCQEHKSDTAHHITISSISAGDNGRYPGGVVIRSDAELRPSGWIAGKGPGEANGG